MSEEAKALGEQIKDLSTKWRNGTGDGWPLDQKVALHDAINRLVALATKEAQSLPEFGGEDVRYFCRACGTKWVGDKLKRIAGPREVVGQHCGGTMEKIERCRKGKP